MPKTLPVLVLAALAFSLTLSAGTAFASRTLVMGTGAPGGNYNLFGRIFAQVINASSAKTGIRIQPVATRGSVDNIVGLIKGRFQLALVQGDTDFLAWKGEGPWQGVGPQKKIRKMCKVYTEAVTCVARMTSGITSCAGLKGKRVALGEVGMGTLDNAKDALALCQLTPKDLGQALYVGPAEAMRLMFQGRLDAFFYTVGHPNSTLRTFFKAYKQCQVVPLPLGGVLRRNKPYYVHYIFWKNNYPDLRNKDRRIDTFGIASYILTTDQVPAKVIYELTRLFWANLSTFRKYMIVMQKVEPPGKADIREFTYTKGAPYHDGVKKLLREKGIVK